MLAYTNLWNTFLARCDSNVAECRSWYYWSLINTWRMRNRSSRSQMFLKIGILKNFTIFTRKHLYWILFLIKLQSWRPITLLKRDPNAGAFLWISRISQNSIFYRTPLVTASGVSAINALKCMEFSIFSRKIVSNDIGSTILNISVTWWDDHQEKQYSYKRR